MGEAVGELEARGAGSKRAPKAARIDAGALDVGQVQGLLGNTIKLSDLLVAKARDASRFAESDEPALCEEDEEPDDPAVTEAEQDLLEEDFDLTAQLQEAVGPYTIPDGYQLSPKPCSSQSEWALMCNAPFWRGKRIAHIAPDGWHVSTFRRKFVGADATPDEGWVFYSKEARLEYIHRLLIEDYGLTLAWLIIEKTEAGDDNDEEIYSRHYTRRAGTARRSN